MVGITSQGVRATATAQVAQGNSVTCIKPWIVADKWTEGDEAPIGGWNQNDTFNPPIDTYTAPGFKATGPNNDYGLELVLKAGNVGTYTAGWTQEIEFPGCPGSACYKAELEGCPTWVPPVNLYNGNIPCAAKTDTPDPSQGCISVKTGMSAGPTGQGVTAIVASDSGASWSTATNSVVGGCMASGTCINPDGVNVSPRIVPIAIFNTGAYYTEANGGACNGGTNCVAQVVNLIGFFVEGMCTDVYPNPASRPAWCGTPSEAAKAVVGRLMNYPGLGVRGAGPATSASFIRILRLVQ